MYNKTGYHTESWDTPTPLSNCHHWCLSGNAWCPEGTRPFVDPMRPGVALRMRWNPVPAWVYMVRYGDLTWNGRDSCACSVHLK